jgi:transcriptional regulator
MHDRFAPRSDADVLRLLHEQTLAWLVSDSGDDVRATPLPLRPVLDVDGHLTHLVGHFSRANPQLDSLRRRSRALVLLLGPNGYVSPSWMADRAQAPTWNYASAQFLVDVELISDADGLRALLDDLIQTLEQGRPSAWSAAEMGERYKALAQRIVGFRARIVETRYKFKLGQDERDDVFTDIVSGLSANGADDLVSWMRDFDQRSS